MTNIQFARSIDALLKGATSLTVIASKARHTRLPKLFEPEIQSLLKKLAQGTDPGDLGAVASSLCGGKPGRVRAGVLPDQISRYNSPARAESVRKVAALSKLGSEKKAALVLVLDKADHALAAVNGVARALPLFWRRKKNPTVGKLQILAVDGRGQVVSIDKTARETVDASRLAAHLVDSPPTEMAPAAFAKETRAALRGIPNVRVSEIKGARLLDKGLRAIHSVGRCALSEPRLVIASYSPPGARGEHVALVGKGITYDTGGLHIKMRGAMETMKADMGGAAAMLGAFRVLASTGVKRKITLLLCMAENAIGPDAYKPDDIVEMHSGLTVEVNNTDAEGRLVLGDGVSYAARVLKAKTIIDAATLTGAQLVATGNLHSAVVSSDDKLERLCLDAGRRSGDLAHPLPFAPEFYKQEFASPVADMRNSVKNRMNAQSSCAAQFIWWQIEDCPVRWAHIDLAGPAFVRDRGTGYGVALVSETVRSLDR